MSPHPQEETQIHTRLLKCALEVEEARAFWAHADAGSDPTPHEAFDAYWFGARSLPRIQVLLTNLRARYSAYPSALWVLHRWPEMSPGIRRAVAHWHLQLSDPMYRAFTGDLLVRRRERSDAKITRDLVVKWVADQGPGRWTMPTRIQFASKLLSCAFAAGLVATARDPRPLSTPRIEDLALEYLMYLLREVQVAGTLLQNPYLASVGLEGDLLEARLRALDALTFRRQGDLVDFSWRYASLVEWGRARFQLDEAPESATQLAGGAQ